ncbi:transposase [Pediococcus acidilactici]|uniref:transposase n=1 Tax=Pediococcus acidilactici TaxID=1254 RepID=UPI00195074F6|nr:transposase [Pediococcus acidilactici]
MLFGIKIKKNCYNCLKPPTTTLLNTFKTRIKSIVHALHSPLSNGRIEGTIRKIKQIQRTVYGYKNW